MITRKLSLNDEYPFTPGAYSLRFIRDLKFTLRGAPSYPVSLYPAYAFTERTVYLSAFNITTTGGYLVFNAECPEGLWSILLTFLKAPGTQVVRATNGIMVMVLETDQLPAPSSSFGQRRLVEPSRVTWLPRDLNTVGFTNEDVAVTSFTGAAGADVVLPLASGYNMQLGIQTDTVVLQAGARFGAGWVPASDVSAGTLPGLRMVNGILPVSGDIAVEVSSDLSLEKDAATGTLTIRAAPGGTTVASAVLVTTDSPIHHPPQRIIVQPIEVTPPATLPATLPWQAH